MPPALSSPTTTATLSASLHYSTLASSPPRLGQQIDERQRQRARANVNCAALKYSIDCALAHIAPTKHNCVHVSNTALLDARFTSSRTLRRISSNSSGNVSLSVSRNAWSSLLFFHLIAPTFVAAVVDVSRRSASASAPSSSTRSLPLAAAVVVARRSRARSRIFARARESSRREGDAAVGEARGARPGRRRRRVHRARWWTAARRAVRRARVRHLRARRNERTNERTRQSRSRR